MIINDLRAKVRKEVLPSVEHLPELLHGAGDDAGDGEGKTKVECSSLVAGQFVGHRPLLVENRVRVLLCCKTKGFCIFSHLILSTGRINLSEPVWHQFGHNPRVVRLRGLLVSPAVLLVGTGVEALGGAGVPGHV